MATCYGWDPDGTNRAEYIADDRITEDSVVVISTDDFYAIICQTNTKVGGGRAWPTAMPLYRKEWE